ncbi:MAG: hypothetical protein WCG10_00090 [Chlamydiota bacterium]
MSVSSYRNFGLQILTLPLSSHVTEGLCKIGGFESLRHGTSVSHFFSILKNGADPKVAVQYATKQPDRKFFVLKDSENSYLSKRLWPRFYAMDKGAIFGASLMKKATSNKRLIESSVVVSMLMHTIFPPMVRFIYRPSEIEKGDIFQGDKIVELRERNGVIHSDAERKHWEEMGALALETQSKLPVDRIGLVGICSHISLQDVSTAIHDNPVRVISGVAELALGGLLTYYGLGWIF